MPAAPWVAEGLLVLLRWLHALASIALLGWVSAYLLGMAPLQPDGTTSRRFKEVSDTTLLVFLASGAVLSFDRLSGGAGNTYAIVLAAKVLLSVVVYQLAFRWRRAGLSRAGPEGRALLAIGLVVVLLAAILKSIFEHGLRT